MKNNDITIVFRNEIECSQTWKLMMSIQYSQHCFSTIWQDLLGILKISLIIIVSIWNYEMEWEAFSSDECPFLNVRTRDINWNVACWWEHGKNYFCSSLIFFNVGMRAWDGNVRIFIVLAVWAYEREHGEGSMGTGAWNIFFQADLSNFFFDQIILFWWVTIFKHEYIFTNDKF